MGGKVIAKHFVALGGSNEGAEWLTLLWDAIQGLDDDALIDAAYTQLLDADAVVFQDLPLNGGLGGRHGGRRGKKQRQGGSKESDHAVNSTGRATMTAWMPP